MGTEAVLTSTHNQCFEKKIRKNIKNYHLKMNIFTAVKYYCILHGRVCVMLLDILRYSRSEETSDNSSAFV